MIRIILLAEHSEGVIEKVEEARNFLSVNEIEDAIVIITQEKIRIYRR